MGRSLGSGLRGFKKSLSGETTVQTEIQPVTERTAAPLATVELADDVESPTAA